MTKFGARRTEVDGVMFHSLGEARRYGELKLLAHAGEITDLQLQVKYPLVVRDIKVADFIADFVYEERGEIVVEDFKSEPTKTPVYRLKKKLMRAIHGIDIRETS